MSTTSGVAKSTSVANFCPESMTASVGDFGSPSPSSLWMFVSPTLCSISLSMSRSFHSSDRMTDGALSRHSSKEGMSR